jgi:hypothetical protein
VHGPGIIPIIGLGLVERPLETRMGSLGNRTLDALALLRHGDANLESIPWPWIAIGVVLVELGPPGIKVGTAASEQMIVTVSKVQCDSRCIFHAGTGERDSLKCRSNKEPLFDALLEDVRQAFD